ncbi:hypothetical protein SAMN00790413_05506 [Deinococcus hopiensis KR-140]|uniref:Uncharacterized protein n=1 Tax=Deinococcus hopiensis KR-140 TaxID=695939 RepID=A0A1W1UH16_9DEIO|nr:hypothetical protein SAMN00790413_05506 [Deinococcus hopiensis KR-140]
MWTAAEATGVRRLDAGDNLLLEWDLRRARSLGVKADNAVLNRTLMYPAHTVKASKELQGDRATTYRSLGEVERVNMAGLQAFVGRTELTLNALAYAERRRLSHSMSYCSHLHLQYSESCD